MVAGKFDALGMRLLRERKHGRRSDFANRLY